MRGIAPFQGNLELSTNLTERLRPRGERQIRVRGAVQIENGASNSFWLDSFPGHPLIHAQQVRSDII